MKNLQYFPFERNRYYYGKLLTEQDFNSEQKYFNDKRRMVNRFLHGVGVAAGFRVVEIDEKSISVEPGFALDGAGRELVLEKPVVMRLEQIDGFSSVGEEEGQDVVYLCAEYEEKKIMPSHSITSHSALEEENVEYDRWKEGVRFYLTTRPLEQKQDTVDDLFYQRAVVYEDRDLCLVQEYPRYVERGGQFLVTLIVENRGVAREWQIDLEEPLACASFEGTDCLRAVVRERMERGAVRRYDFWLKAYSVEMGEVRISAGEKQLKIFSGGKQEKKVSETVLCIPVVSGNKNRVMAERYYQDAMNRVLKNTCPSGIYLAKISLIGNGQVYLIDQVTPMPFRQYVYPDFLAMGLIRGLLAEKRQGKQEIKEGEGDLTGPKEERQGQAAEGTVEIELGVGGKRGQRFFSHEIVHGLGLGRVSIILGIENNQEQLFGSSEIFDDFSPKAELAAKADKEKGSFVIGVRLLEATGQRRILVHWRAFLEQDGESRAVREARLSIRPDKLELKVRETCYLEAVPEGMPGATILWDVVSRQGGMISFDGRYTAPGAPGVYEIQAWCQEQPQVRASLYVIVRE